MGSWNKCKKNGVPFAAMAAVECGLVAMNTLYKAAHAKGLNYFVYTTYSRILASPLLFLLSFFFSR
ncbi:WAT1-related protein [Parasponia andersonii]|uniref:WAT1-related protein n=1 Tax=Parasponia andersonii TaxID=3476 RepID=A0A2P5BF78_PARAD|nr:WAT1-related protein [Parasponia andersonii]